LLVYGMCLPDLLNRNGIAGMFCRLGLRIQILTELMFGKVFQALLARHVLNFTHGASVSPI